METKKKLYEVDVKTDKKLVVVLNIIAVVMAIPLFWIFEHIASSLATTDQSNGLPFLVLIGMLVILVLIHEAIHGLFFKLFCPKNPVKYGIKWKTGMAYAVSPGSRYNRIQTVVIALAPFVLINSVLTILALVGWLDEMSYTMLVTMHTVACIGDFYYTYLLVTKFKRKAIEIEVTEQSLMIYQA